MTIVYFRPEEYEKPFFSTGDSVLQGIMFPLTSREFNKATKVRMSPYWKKVLGSAGIVVSNLSYPKRAK